MYKVIYKMYDALGDELGQWCYWYRYTEIRGAQRMLKAAFMVDASNKEKEISKLEGYKVVRSYFKPACAISDTAMRFYIVEEDE